MASRRRSNRIVLQEAIEESRKEAEEAIKSQRQQQPPLSSEKDDDTTSAGGGRRRPKDRGADDDAKKSGGGLRRGTSVSGRSAAGDDNSSAPREAGRKRLRKLNEDAPASKKSNVSKKGRAPASGDGGEDDGDVVVVLSDGVGDPDLENSDDSSGDAGRGITRKASRGGAARGVVRNSNKRKPLSIHDDVESQGGSDVNDSSDAEDVPVDRKRSQPTTTVNSKSSSSVSIPKKATIPRRKPDSSTQSPSSLLAHMKPAQPSVDPLLPQGSSRHHPSSKFKPPTGPTASQPTATKTHQDPYASANATAPSQRMSPKQDSTTESAVPAVAKRFVPPSRPSQPPPSSNRAGGLPKHRVMDDLERLCDALGDDARFALPPAAGVDLSGSFLGDDGRYDFFDTNQFGEIVFQPKVPIFPEEFPPGMAEHSLSWWGVLDLDLGDGKFRAPMLPPHGTEPGPPPVSGPGGSNGFAGPGGQVGFQQAQWNYQLPNLQPQRSGQWATSQPQPGMTNPQGRGPNSWTPPRQGGAGRTGGGGGYYPPANNRRYTPPRNYDRR